MADCFKTSDGCEIAYTLHNGAGANAPRIALIHSLALDRSIWDDVAQELLPGASRDSDAELDAHIRATSATAHHPMGTCRMGLASDPQSVVDAQLRVHGVDGLRVVDASVMPDQVGATSMRRW